MTVGRYARPGAAVMKCPECGESKRFEWAAGDPFILTPEHCAGWMRQVTHNDGVTPLEELCPSYCCQPHEAARSQVTA